MLWRVSRTRWLWTRNLAITARDHSLALGRVNTVVSDVDPNRFFLVPRTASRCIAFPSSATGKCDVIIPGVEDARVVVECLFEAGNGKPAGPIPTDHQRFRMYVCDEHETVSNQI
jgi:hypothetical protein